MTLFQIPVNYNEVKTIDVQSDSLQDAIERVEYLISIKGLDRTVTSINYKELLLQTIEKKEPKMIEMSFDRWVEDYKPIVNPFNLSTQDKVEAYPWDAYFFNSAREKDLSVTTCTSTAFVWTVLKDACNIDRPYKAFYEYFSANYDFEQAANCYEEWENIVWSPHLKVAGYFITTKAPKNRDASISVRL